MRARSRRLLEDREYVEDHQGDNPGDAHVTQEVARCPSKVRWTPFVFFVPSAMHVSRAISAPRVGKQEPCARCSTAGESDSSPAALTSLTHAEPGRTEG